jgi:hypothetical protein
VATPAHASTPPWSERLISEFTAADRRATLLAASLTPDQLNWKPAPEAWSIGQCLQHLTITNQVYLPAISTSLEGRPRSPVDEIVFGWFGAWFIRKFIEPSPQGSRAKAPKKIDPGPKVDPGVLDAFVRSNQAARDLVAKARDYDVNRIRFKNPFIALIRFTVGTGLEIVSKHQNRHLLQAERVRQSAGFPE